MIAAKKGQEPEGLKQLREGKLTAGLSPKEQFDELKNPLKKEVLDCLLQDQGGLCVYCMSRIPVPLGKRDPGIVATSIEHFIPLDLPGGKDVGQALDYQNLFAVCHGNMKSRKSGVRRAKMDDLTCDKHRGNAAFRKIDPLRGETMETIFYKMTGEIDAEDPDIQYDLTVTLNLNCPNSPLVRERQAALDSLLADVGVVDNADLLEYCKSRLEAFCEEGNPKTPYVGILMWYLRSLISALIISQNDCESSPSL